MAVSGEKVRGRLLRLQNGNRVASLAAMHRVQSVSKRMADDHIN